MRALLLVCILSSPFAFAGPPAEAMKKFNQAATGKRLETAWKHIAQFKGMDARATEEYKNDVRQLIEFLANGGEIQIVDEKIEGHSALVITNTAKKGYGPSFDPDPIYLIKTGGTWKILPDFTEWELAKTYAKEQVGSFKKLEAWYSKRKAELRKAYQP